MDQENELIELAGSVDSVIYKNEENGYTVLRLVDSNGELVTVVGCFPYAAAGESMIISGVWTTHSVHGKQFKAEYAQRMLPASAPAIYDYLAGGAVRGIGPATALLLVNRFGDKTLEVLESSPDKIAQIKGISLQKATQLSETFRRQSGMRRLMEFICSFGLRPVLAIRLYRYYGDSAMAIIRDNPYLLAAPHIGGSFAEADDMALELGVELKSENRIAAAAIFELEYNAGGGHCFIPREKLADITAQMIDVEPERIDDVIESMITDRRVIFEQIAGCNACYLPKLYEAERFTAERIAAMSKEKYASRMDFSALITALEKKQGIEYAPLQRQTLQYALENQIVVITGGPGTGKTTTIRAILAMFDRLGLKTLLAAPTGRAAKRMTELTGCEAATIHRLLGARFAEDEESVVFGKNAGDLLECEAVILDECSMVDISLMSALLEAMPADARLVLVGDADQLPSVGPGDVFSAIIRSEAVPVVRLTEIFRQNRNSRIVRNAHMINRGEHPDLSENAGDFFRLKRLQAASTVDTITELCATRLPQKMGIPPEEIQVLSPTKKGELGTINLNKHLQEALNPPAKEKKEKLFGTVVFREGDRIMQIRNNYDIMWRSADNTAAGSGIYNGDIGVIRKIDTEQETLTVEFDGRIAVYTFDMLLELEHAWAMTVHKSQGSEFRAVILSLCAASQMLMSRDILYTAVTRAKELLILVGDDQIAFRMIDNVRQSRRYNALRLRIRNMSGIQGDR
ncbi:MAG: ATP-dependent RecD-like DNA helicase [Oscillospiraceae bacterium]|nr:ATP-dependent RecD-like DNA helicase [Oscillospiraceae bacterium]